MGIVTLLILVAVVIPMVTRKQPEGFQSSARDEYVRIGQMRYNKLSDTKNITKPNMFGATTMGATDAANAQIAAATATTEMREDATSPTGVSTRSSAPRLTIAPPSETLAESNKCEAVKGRAACGRLGSGEFSRCGVCIKGGTAFSLPDDAGNFIGGLLVLPEDKEAAEAEAAAAGGAPVYQPSVGDCPAGSFFVTRDACEEAANRADCEEVGASGGFDGRTIEGKTVADVKCASIGTESGNWIYDPKDRAVRVRLRVVAPVGTGITRVIVKNAAGGTVGSTENRRGDGKPVMVNIPAAAEGERFTITFIQEVPYRQSTDATKAEVFQYAVSQTSPIFTNYTLEKSAAEDACNRIGTRLATREELVAAQTSGAQVCSAGWTSTTSAYPLQAAATGCGGAPGVVNWNPENQKANAWCYGHKPPAEVQNMAFFTRIFSWFESLGKAASPSQEEMPTQWSQHGGGEYQTPFRRAVMAQWESIDGQQKADVLPSVLKVDGIMPNSAGVFGNLRKFGTLQSNSLILQPRASSVPEMLGDKQWFWSSVPTSQTMSIEVFVPGTFLAPAYAADKTTSSAPLITQRNTLKLLRASPCDGQRPGAFNSECLSAIFVGEGGDINRGELATTLENLNRVGGGSEEEIRAYLREFYTVATTGKGSGGMPATREVINDAARKMFGFELVSPCEDLSISETGAIMLVPKTGSVDADCMQWLWHNTGNDRERGNTDLSRKTTIQNTYTLISDRYSGLRSTEGSRAERAGAPFRACQDTGTMAPKDPRGAVRTSAVRAAQAQGGVLEIQDFYDSIHRTANYRGGSAAAAAAHEKALAQCYGITKAPGAASTPGSNECGPKARYVRVLVSGHSSASNTAYLPIQIPQIQVYDGAGREVARGKPTTANSVWPGSAAEFAVNGDARPHSHGEGEYHDNGQTPRRQFWMVDLGSEMEISRIVYYPRTDCCTDRQIAAPVQLLNSARKVVAVKYIGSVNVPSNRWAATNPETLPVTPVDGKPTTALAVGARVSFQSATSFNRYMRHAGYVFWSHGPDAGPASYSSLLKLDASFLVRAGAGGLRFESVNFPNFFIAVGGGGRLQIQNNPAPTLSTFIVSEAVNGDPAAISLKPVSGGGFVSTDPNSPDVVTVTTVDTGDVWDVQRGAWRVVPALA